MDDEARVVLARHKLDVDEYSRMAEAGILGEDDRVELIDGEIIDMAPIGESHAAVVNRLNRALVLACGDQGIVSPQHPVRLDRLNEPQPDFAIIRARADFYETGKPGPADVLLLIEVGDSSLGYDRAVKLPLYARANIPEVWIVDLKRRLVDAYRAPESGAYTEQSTHRPGETIALALAPEIEIAVDRVFS